MRERERESGRGNLDVITSPCSNRRVRKECREEIRTFPSSPCLLEPTFLTVLLIYDGYIDTHYLSQVTQVSYEDDGDSYSPIKKSTN